MVRSEWVARSAGGSPCPWPGRALTHPCKQGLLQQRDVVACPGVMGQSDKSLHPSAAGLRASAAVRGKCGGSSDSCPSTLWLSKRTTSGTCSRHKYTCALVPQEWPQIERTHTGFGALHITGCTASLCMITYDSLALSSRLSWLLDEDSRLDQQRLLVAEHPAAACRP